MNKTYFIGAVIFACLVFYGCAANDSYLSAGDSINTKIQIGMSMKEVKAIMGEPRISGYVWNPNFKEQLLMWDYREKGSILKGARHLTVYFKEGKVVDIRDSTEQRFDL